MPNQLSTAATIDRTIKEARPIDDIFSRSVFRSQYRLVEKLLRAILQMPDLHVVHMETQRDVRALSGHERSLTLDIYAEDSTGKIYNIELQCNPAGADPHRARFHLSALDRSKLGPRDSFSTLPDACVIFITEDDCIGDGELFHRYRYRDDEGRILDTGQEIWYVNASFTGTPPAGAEELADWAHDFLTRDADDMRVPELATRVRFFKDNSEGRREMASTIEQLFKERDQKRDQERDKKRDRELACSLYRAGVGIETIASCVGLPEAEILVACNAVSESTVSPDPDA